MNSKQPRVWNSGPPPHVGWWNASANYQNNIWRWWDGKQWSIPVLERMVGPYLDTAGKTPCFACRQEDIKWTDYWPENARVSRKNPNA